MTFLATHNIAVAVGILILTFVVAFLFNRFFIRLVEGSANIMKNDPTNYLFLRHFLVAMIYLVGFGFAIFVIPELRAVAGSLLAGAGILAVAVGFASQHALSNVISGVFIVIFKPFRINDRLKVQAFEGVVEDITLRHTIIRDFENKRIIIPNALISDEILVNSDLAEEKICKYIDVQVAYNTDLPTAKQIMAEEIIKHPLHLDPRTEEDIDNGLPEVNVRVIALADSGIQLRAWAWAQTAGDGFVLRCDLLESIKLRFDEMQIEIPYPHQKVVFENFERSE